MKILLDWFMRNMSSTLNRKFWSFVVGLMPIFGNLSGYRLTVESVSLLVIFSLVIIRCASIVGMFLFGLLFAIQIASDFSVNSVALLLWGSTVVLFLVQPKNLRIDKLAFLIGLVCSLVATYMKVWPDFVLKPTDRYNGFFSSVLAFGFVTSAVIILLMSFRLSILIKFFLIIFFSIGSIPSGSRHPIAIGACAIFTLALVDLRFIVVLALLIALVCSAILLADFGNLYFLRSILPNDFSDTERLNRFKSFFVESDLYAILFGIGREKNGSLAIALGYTVNQVLESSWVTFLSSYGLIVTLLAFLVFFVRIRQTMKYRATYFLIPMAIVHLFNGLLSQAFENPVMLLVYFLVFSLILTSSPQLDDVPVGNSNYPGRRRA